MENIRIALVQMESIVGKTEENINKIEEFVQEAKRKRVQIICFPELSVHGYTKNKAKELAEQIPGRISEKIRSLAVENNISIITGMIEKSDNENPYITQLVCLNTGKIFIYRKTHLGLSERTSFSSGSEFFVFKIEQCNFAIQICWETHFPEIATIQSLNGAEIIFTPFASPDKVGDRRQIWLKYLTARAYDNSVFIASCNLIGTNGLGVNFAGGCLVINPKGDLLAEDFSQKEGMLVVDLPKKEINEIRTPERKSMKYSYFLQYRRKELYNELK